LVEDANITAGGDVTVTASGAIGRTEGSITINNWSSVKNWATDLTETQRLALSYAERDDITYYDAAGNKIADPRRSRTPIAKVMISQKQDVDIDATGEINLTASGNVFLGSEQDINLDQVKSGSEVRIKAAQGIYDVAIAGATNITATDLVLEAGSASVGTSANTITIDLADKIYYNNGKLYLLSNSATWENAQTYAQSLGGNLVTLNDATEEAWLKTTFGTAENFWIGLTDKVTEGTFAWANGETSTYRNWAAGEPSNSGGNEDYVVMNWNGNHQWNDESSTATRRGIIELNVQEYNGHFYLLNPTATWETAQTAAQTLGGNLVTINDASEEQWLRNTFSTTESLWTGLTDKVTEGSFTWASGETLSYTNWAPGEPNNFGGNEDYIAMNYNGKWNDDSSTATKRGVVEISSLGSSLIARAKENIYVSNLGNLNIDEVYAGDTVCLSSTGAIIDANQNSAANIQSDFLTLSAISVGTRTNALDLEMTNDSEVKLNTTQDSYLQTIDDLSVDFSGRTSGAVNITGDSSNNTITLYSSSDSLNSSLNINVDAGGGSDTVIIKPTRTTNILYVTDISNPTVQTLTGSGLGNIAYRNTEKVTITPVAGNDSVTTTESASTTFAALSNDADFNGSNAITISAINNTAVTSGSSVTLTSGAIVSFNANNTFTYNPNGKFESISAGKTATDTFTYSVKNSAGGVDTATVTITLNGVNDAPIATKDSAATDEATTVTISALSNDSDIDADDVLSITHVNGTSITSGTTRTLTSGAQVTFNANGTFSYNPNGKFEYLGMGKTATDSFTYTISDGKGGSSTATVTLTIDGINDAPIALVNHVTTLANSVTTGGNYYYNGKLYLLSSSATWENAQTYAQNLGGNLVTINDATEEAWLKSTFGTSENFWIGLTDKVTEGTFAWANGETATYRNWAAGEPSNSGGNEDYAVMNWNGNRQWNDEGSTATRRGIIELSVQEYNGHFYLLNPNATWETSQASAQAIGGNLVTINDAAEEQWLRNTFSLTEGFWIGLTDKVTEGNFQWISGETSTYRNWAAGEPNNWNGNEDYTAMNYSGSRQWNDSSSTATMRGLVEINSLGSSLTGTISPLSNDSDIDFGDTINITKVNGTSLTAGSTMQIASKATVTLNANGTFTYNPNGKFDSLGVNTTATDSFTYTISDGKGGTSTATVTMTIVGINDAPTANADSASTNEDLATTIAILSNDSDIDVGDSISITQVNGSNVTSGSTITLTSGAKLTYNTNGTFTYNPNGKYATLGMGETGTDSFTYTISDGKGGTSTATVSLTISGGTFSERTGSNNPFNGVDVGYSSAPAFADIDKDGDLDAFVGESDSTINYYRNTNGSFAEVTGTSNPFNGIKSGFLDSKISFADIDQDGDLDAFIGDSKNPISYYQNNNGSFTKLTGTSNPFNSITDYGTASFVDIDNDGDLDAFMGQADGTIKFYRNTNKTFAAVTGTSNPFNGIDVGDSASIAFADIDQDGDSDAFIGEYDGTINYYRNTNGSFAAVTGSANLFNGVDVGQNSTIAFADINGDGDLDAFIGEFDGNINYFENTNTPPVAVNDIATTNEGASVTISALSNDTDANAADTLTITRVNGSTISSGSTITLTSGARLTLNSSGTFSYNPNGKFEYLGVGKTATDSFTYTMKDGKGGTSNTATVTLTVTGVNDGPTAIADSVTTDEDTSTTITALSNDSDIDTGDTFSITQVNGTAISSGSTITLTSGARLTFNSNGTFTYNPNGKFSSLNSGQQGTDSFTYTISDGKGGTGTATVTMTITGLTFRERIGTANPFNGLDVGDKATPAFADIDKDGDLDAFVGSADGTIRYYRNTNGSYAQVTGTANPFNGLDFGDNSSISFADIDRDGDLDAFIGSSKGVISYYRNNNGAFTQDTNTTLFSGLTYATTAPTFADIDNDGDLDAFITNASSSTSTTGSIAFYRNTNGSFAQVTGTSNPFNGVSVSANTLYNFADIDKDGDLDMFIGDGKGGIAYYRNTNGSFSQQTGTTNPLNNITGVSTSNTAITFADIDGDGDLDTIVGQADGAMKYLENK
jgi:hypothetical protein